MCYMHLPHFLLTSVICPTCAIHMFFHALPMQLPYLFHCCASTVHLMFSSRLTCFYHTFSAFPTCVPHMFLTIYTVDSYLVTLVYSLFDSSFKDSELTQKGYLLLEHKRRTSRTRTCL